jgi:hypothetical protein
MTRIIWKKIREEVSQFLSLGYRTHLTNAPAYPAILGTGHQVL